MQAMKYLKHTLYAAVAALAVTTACTGDFEEYNTNPNKLTQGSITSISMLEPLLYSATNSFDNYMLAIANEISQVTVAKSTPRREHCYNLSNQNFQQIWNLCYKWAKNADHMYDLAVEQNQPNFQAIGLTLKVYYMSICTDMFGSVAYTEALKGDEGNLKPRIDSQKEVYEAMMADLETANSLYNPSQEMEDPAKDAIYAGDITKWQKFTNTLHLRLLMRVSGRNDAFNPTVGDRIRAIIDNPTTYPVFTSNADNATVKFSGTATYYRNYFNTTTFPNDTSLSGDHHVASQFLGMIYNAETGFADPRMYVWIKPRYVNNEIREMVGALSGCTIEFNSNSIRSDKEPYLHYETLVRDTNPNRLLDYDELLFIKAEAAMKGWIGGSAQEYYEAAVTASCEKWNEYGQYAAYPVLNASGEVVLSTVSIGSKEIAAFLASDEGKWDGTEQRLAEQKWLALFWVVGFQMYHEMRRTGYPECMTGEGTVDLGYTDGKFIARYAYPQIAIANNRANYEAAFVEQGATLNDNNMILPVWWSGQAVAKDAGTPWEHSFRHNIIADESQIE